MQVLRGKKREVSLGSDYKSGEKVVALMTYRCRCGVCMPFNHVPVVLAEWMMACISE
jgi:hypothetical protein